MDNNGKSSGVLESLTVAKQPEVTPEILVTTSDNTAPHCVLFEELYPLKDQLQSITLLWNANCYLVNAVRNYVIINGGRRLQLSALQKCRDRKVIYRKRNMMQVSVVGKEPLTREITYIIGVSGVVANKPKLILLQISSDGTTWTWRDAL